MKLGFFAKDKDSADAVENSMKNFQELFGIPYGRDINTTARKLLDGHKAAETIINSALDNAVANSKATKSSLVAYSRDELEFILEIILSGYPAGLTADELDADAATAATDSAEGLKKTIEDPNNTDLAALIDSSKISAAVDDAPKIPYPPIDAANERDIFILIKPTDVTAMLEGIIESLGNKPSESADGNGITKLENTVKSLKSNATDYVRFESYERKSGSESVTIFTRMYFSNKTDDEMNQEGISFISDIQTAMDVQTSRKLFASKELEAAGGSLAGAEFQGVGAYAPQSFKDAASAGAVRVIASTLLMAAASFLLFA